MSRPASSTPLSNGPATCHQSMPSTGVFSVNRYSTTSVSSSSVMYETMFSGMIDTASFVRVSMSFLSIFVSLALASRSVIEVGVSSTMRPLMEMPSFLSIFHWRYWSAMALLGRRIDSYRFSRLAFLPIIDRSGPTWPPAPRIVWHLRHCMSFLALAASSVLPLAASPTRLASTAIGGSFFGSILGGGGNRASALSCRSGRGCCAAAGPRRAARRQAAASSPPGRSATPIPARVPASADAAACRAPRSASLLVKPAFSAASAGADPG